jgi:hypothetical protein
MPRRTRRPFTLALALVGVLTGVALAACQDYNFSPVRYCLIQPGSERVTLSDVSTADLLFVVDDSGSMGGEQQKLQASFDAFVRNLQDTNTARVSVKLEPIDFHIAITTTSVFLNAQTNATCSTSCGGAAGQQVCCSASSNLPLQVARACTTTADCGGVGSCLDTCAQHAGELVCCAAPGAPAVQAPLACADVGAACGRLQTRYAVTRAPRLCATSGGVTTSCSVGPDGTGANPAPAGYACKTTCNGLGGTSACCDAAGNVWSDPTCDIGVGSEGGLYPRGDFVRKGSNPRVLHFDKSLFCDRAVDPATSQEVCACTLSADPLACNAPGGNAAAIPALVSQFQQNIAVGTCGSGQEQGLEAARRAIEKALAGTQPAEAGGEQPDWPHPRRVVAPGERAPSKLVVVFVGDEDDCSTAEDVTGGVIFANSGNDACEADGALPEDQQKRTRLSVYAEFLGSLGRPVAGAFIVSATGAPCAGPAECQALCGADTCPSNCVDGDCRANICCDTACTGDANVCTLAGLCGGQGAGYRFIDFSKVLIGRGADTVVGSVCNPGQGAAPPASVPPPYLKPGFSSILERVAEVVKQPAGLQLPTQPAAAQLTLLRIAAPDGKTRKTCVGPAPAGTSGAALDGYDWWFTGGDDTDRSPTGPSKFIFLNLSTRNCEANPGETYSADYLGLVPASGCLTGADCQAALGGTLEDWTCDLTQGGARGSCLCGQF